ncbi:MAG: serine protease [Acidobacteriota bacterium]|nr:serine protease [Acidobacteriota bacterium]
MTLKGDLESAIRKITQKLKDIRSRYDAAQTLNILDAVPPVLTDDEVDRKIAEGQLADLVEGVWTDTEQYRLAIVAARRSGEYEAVVLEKLSTGISVWRPGMIKARLSRAADGRTFALRWMDAMHREDNGVAVLEEGATRLVLSVANSTNKRTFIKLKPTPPSSNVSGASREGRTNPRSAVATGTGFFVADGYIATNFHVVREGSVFELATSDAVIGLDLVVSDPVNDLAILRTKSAATQRPLPLSTSEIILGAEAVVVGFPLGGTLGDGHKVTTGVVSAIDGLNNDPRMFQLTAPIQPGSSGSPVFNMRGTVIGVVTSTLDVGEAARQTGTQPQNVNFAMKADYLSLLVRRIPNRPSVPESTSGSLLTPGVVDLVRSSVVRIMAYR